MDLPDTLYCECGYVAQGASPAGLVETAQEHALVVHGLNLPPALLLRDLHPREIATGDGQPSHGAR